MNIECGNVSFALFELAPDGRGRFHSISNTICSLLVCIKNPAHPIPLTVLLDVEPRLVDDDSPVSGEDLHGDPQGSNEDEKPNGETQRRHQQ